MRYIESPMRMRKGYLQARGAAVADAEDFVCGGVTWAISGSHRRRHQIKIAMRVEIEECTISLEEERFKQEGTLESLTSRDVAATTINTLHPFSKHHTATQSLETMHEGRGITYSLYSPGASLSVERVAIHWNPSGFP